MAARKPSYLKLRGHSYYWQIAVPRELRAKVGRAVVGGALHTRDVAEAHAKSWVEIAKAKEHFARLHGVSAANETLPSDALLQIDEYARGAYTAELAKMHAGVWDKAELEKANLDIWEAYETGDYASVAEPLATYCQRHTIECGSALYKATGDALLMARLYAVIGRKDALDHKARAAPRTFLNSQIIDPLTLRPLTARKGLRFSEAADKFLTERQRDSEYALSEQSRAIYATVFRLFNSWGGQPTLEEIDRRRAADFIDAVSSLDPRWGRSQGAKNLSFADIVSKFGNHPTGLSTLTVNRYPTALGLVWKHAEKRLGFEGKNVWTGQTRPTTKHRGDANSGKRPFTPAEVRNLLEQRPTIAFDAASSLRWIVCIAAYSAMRLEEIASLTVMDVQETDGVHFFNVAKAKTDAGVRVVPVHSEILGAGLLAYCDAVKDGPLFPALKPRGSDGKRGKRITKLFAKLRNDLGLIDIDATTGRGRTDFHSLRRSAITALKHAGIPEHEIAELVGHEYGRITMGTYAGRHRLGRLQAIVAAIRYDY